jgi:hypothetical protein
LSCPWFPDLVAALTNKIMLNSALPCESIMFVKKNNAQT